MPDEEEETVEEPRVDVSLMLSLETLEVGDRPLVRALFTDLDAEGLPVAFDPEKVKFFVRFSHEETEETATYENGTDDEVTTPESGSYGLSAVVTRGPFFIVRVVGYDSEDLPLASREIRRKVDATAFETPY